MIIQKKPIVSVIGLGYIGLPTSAVLARSGYKVNGMDTNTVVNSTINAGQIHIKEPLLDELVQKMVLTGRLKAYDAVQPAEIYIICVPTPFTDGFDIPSPDISYVLEAAKNIAKFIKTDDLIILESTSPLGTTEVLRDVLVEQGADIEGVHIAYCPERVLPGNIIEELVQNDRIIGGLDTRSSQRVSEFYKTFVNGEIFETDSRTAEMCKLTENSFRDVNIAFANELSMYCDKNGVDVWKLINLANRHPRVNILQPGTGVGGHCIAVDPWFLISSDPQNSNLIRKAREVNNSKPLWVIDKIKQRCVQLKTKKIFCLGLAFKPDVDDLRGSPSAKVVEDLIMQGYDVKAVEPNINNHDEYELVTLSDVMHSPRAVVAILVRHKEFNTPIAMKSLTDLNAMDFCGLLEATN
ncbi:UDP-N-acetyl-D-mannosamine dehydrogenase [Amylibacter sp.]|nr:UDP-N-acetyl-D-mannosamine dehydrogenase [Amylibacter sp.]